MDDKVTDEKRYCAVCVNRGRIEKDRDSGGVMHCRVYNLTGEKICIEKGHISFERDSQAQEAPRDFTVQEFAALPKKFRDHYLRMASELAARDMESKQAQEATKAASGLHAKDLAVLIHDKFYFGREAESVELIEADRAAQRQAGREEAFRHYGMISTYPNLPDGDERKKAYFCGVSDASTRHAALVGLLREAKEFVEIYKARNPKWLSGDSVQDPSGAHKLSESIDKALSDLGE